MIESASECFHVFPLFFLSLSKKMKGLQKYTWEIFTRWWMLNEVMIIRDFFSSRKFLFVWFDAKNFSPPFFRLLTCDLEKKNLMEFRHGRKRKFVLIKLFCKKNFKLALSKNSSFCETTQLEFWSKEKMSCWDKQESCFEIFEMDQLLKLEKNIYLVKWKLFHLSKI